MSWVVYYGVIRREQNVGDESSGSGQGHALPENEETYLNVSPRYCLLFNCYVV